MRVAIEMPHYAPDAVDGRVAGWFKSVGDQVERGEPVAEVETDKAIMDLEAPVSGTLAEIVHPEDATVAVGVTIGWIEAVSG